MRDHATFSRRSLLGALGLFPATRLLRAWQQTEPAQQPPATFSTNVKVVNVLATVRDKTGHVVNDLTRDDFLLDEDGRAQVIRYFSRETDLPLTLGLLVDTSGSQRNVLADERLASYHFLDKMMREGKDMAFVIHFDFEVELLEDLSSSRQTLRKALDELEIGTARRQQGNQEHGRNVSGVAASMLDRLMAYDWPGNGRELRNTIERAGILCADGAPLDAGHLPAGFRKEQGPA